MSSIEGEGDGKEVDRPPRRGREIMQVLIGAVDGAANVWLIFAGNDDETSTWVKASVAILTAVRAAAGR